MNWDQIIGQHNLKKLLQESISEKRVSHAQLFTGKEGYGVFPLVLAYAQHLLSTENQLAATKVAHLNHVDVQISFPVFTENKNSLSQRLYEDFRQLMMHNPYADLEDFSRLLQSENKQFFISADEMEEIVKKFSLKSFEGGTKILIIWRADKMNVHAANKFLKFLEEPPEKTIILLTAENAEDLLPTILSRTQLIEVPRIENQSLKEALQKETQFSEEKLNEIVHQSQGNYNTALQLLQHGNLASEFETLFIQWVREAFLVKKKPELLKNIIFWAREISGWTREKQKTFLDYCAEIFRLALMQNYAASNLVYKKLNSGSFNWEKFSNYIHGANIESILDEISSADYQLERNGNSKIIWTDLGIKLTRYLHRSAVSVK